MHLRLLYRITRDAEYKPHTTVDEIVVPFSAEAEELRDKLLVGPAKGDRRACPRSFRRAGGGLKLHYR